MNGTDFVPQLLTSRAGRGYKCFLLGGTEEMNARAADFVRERFPGFEVAGRHHGYLADDASSERAVAAINAAAPHVLLVGMGNPIQERWIERWNGKQASTSRASLAASSRGNSCVITPTRSSGGL